MPHTPVTILTGFLGSGKTTLLNRALRDPAMANTAVVINEFGEVGLDHMLAAQSDDTIMVLENGCLCCTVFGDLVTTLNNLYHAREAGEIPRFDHVVIETSGLADPSPLIQAFLSDPVLAGLYRIGSVVATVDAVNGPGTLDNHVESVRQVALADHILLTKLDLVDPAHAKEIEASLIARLVSAASIPRQSDFRASTIAPTLSTSPRLRGRVGRGSATCYAPRASIRPTRRPMRAPGSMPPPTSRITRIIMIMTIITTITIIIICTTATLPRSALSATRRSRARRCACCSMPCSKISGLISCG